MQRIDHLIKASYQFPSLVIFADGNIFPTAAGTFPENAGSTGGNE